MTIIAGIWIDQSKAVVLRLSDDGEDLHQIVLSDKKAAHLARGARAKSAQTRSDFVAEDKLARKAGSSPNKYYDEVIGLLKDVDLIFILGPDEAKEELKKHIESTKLKGEIAHVETVDKMTDHEIAWHVRQLLGIGSAQAGSTTA